MAFNKEQFIEDLKAMSVLELNEVVKAIEEEFGVSAAAVAAVAGPAGDAVEENPNKTVTLVSAGSQKVKVIQAIRAIDGSLGLKEAKALADNGGVLADNIPAEDAAAMIAKLEEVGATAEAK